MSPKRFAKFKRLIVLEVITLLLCIPFLQRGFANDDEPDKEKAPEILIIAHRGTADDAFKPDQIRDIFLGNKTKWGNGKKITFFVLKKGKVHESFLERFVHKSAIQFTKYWRYQVFTGVGRAPKSLSSESKLFEYVVRTPGSIGYISVKEAEKLKILKDDTPENKKVKVIKILNVEDEEQ